MLKHITTLLVLILALSAHAEVKPNGLFSDNMVLQQGAEIPVWGTARDGETVTVELNGQKATTTARDGKWRVQLKNLSAGGPYTLTLRGDNVVTIQNVLVGEVWVCGGQSNMARTLVPPDTVQPRQPYWTEEAAAANYPQIRQFRVGGKALDEPSGEVIGSWEVCSPQTAPGFTAAGYFLPAICSRYGEFQLVSLALPSAQPVVPPGLRVNCWKPTPYCAPSLSGKSDL